jgi:aryl-alcohol dehydrogenase-like predicted oxidoreductase
MTAMRTARIGSLEVSVIGLGCNNFGRALDLDGTRAVVDASLEAGITFFDTSDNYGEGRSESFLGQALGRRRDEVVIATKFGMAVSGVPDSGGADPSYIRRAVERSLEQLGTDHIDLYQQHKPDPSTPHEAILEELDRLVAAGKIREIGCSNLDAGTTRAAIELSRSGGLPAFVSTQVEYSLLHREPETNGLVDLHADHGLSILPYYPLASGMLTGKARRGEELVGRLRMDRYERFRSDRNFEVVERLRPFADERGLTMPQVALGWLASRPWVPAVTAGATRPEQVRANVAAAEWTPSEEDLRLLDGITAAVPG